MTSEPKRRGGRPPKATTLSVAERVKAHRARKQASAVAAVESKPAVTIAALHEALAHSSARIAALQEENAALNARLAKANGEISRLEKAVPRNPDPADYDGHYPAPKRS